MSEVVQGFLPVSDNLKANNFSISITINLKISLFFAYLFVLYLKEHVFDWGDVLCNWLGSCLGLFISEKLESHYRHQRELRRLYQPLDVPDEEYGDGDDDYDEYDYEANRRRPDDIVATDNNNSKQNISLQQQELQPQAQQPQRAKSSVNNDVWGASEEIFSVGDDL